MRHSLGPRVWKLTIKWLKISLTIVLRKAPLLAPIHFSEFNSLIPASLNLQYFLEVSCLDINALQWGIKYSCNELGPSIIY